eukprot:4452021-Pleurochrysis_carterae.AAC.1
MATPAGGTISNDAEEDPAEASRDFAGESIAGDASDSCSGAEEERDESLFFFTEYDTVPSDGKTAAHNVEPVHPT